MPAISNHRTDPETSNGIETIHTDLDNRWIKDDLASILSGSNHIKSKPVSLARLNVEILRANSPTLKRLAALVNKSIHETSHSSNREKQAPINARTSSQKTSISTAANLDTGPLDKITYEKTRSRNGSVKKKCSLEIWLPKAGSDDEDNGYTHRTTSPDSDLIEKKSQSPQIITIKSRLSNTIKIPSTNIETKSLDERLPKRSEPIIIPRVYRYEDYLTDQSEERPRSDKSGGTNKSDGDGSNKNSRHQRPRPHIRRQPGTTNQNEQGAQPGTTILPMTSKNLLANIKQTNPGYEARTSIGSNNSSMINELMKKYSMIKKSHEDLTQAKLQLEKPHDSKNSAHMCKDNALPSPPVSDSASYSSSDHPIITVRKLLVDTSPPQSAVDPNRKLLDRRSSHHKSSYSNILPQARLFSLVHHLQYRQTSASMSTALLPPVVGKKNDDPFRSFQRSKTLDVSNDNISSIEIPSQLPHRPDSPETVSTASNSFHRITNGVEPTSSYISKRSLPPPPPLLTLRPEKQQQIERPVVQLLQYQNVQNSAQRYHHSAHPSTTAVATKKVLVHLKYSNGGNADHNCLIPE